MTKIKPISEIAYGYLTSTPLHTKATKPERLNRYDDSSQCYKVSFTNKSIQLGTYHHIEYYDEISSNSEIYESDYLFDSRCNFDDYASVSRQALNQNVCLNDIGSIGYIDFTINITRDDLHMLRNMNR